jgi:hypothetical protein
MHNLWISILHSAGIDNVSGPQYGFWSGVGSVILPPLFSISALGAIYLRKHNCHVKGCWRLGHTVPGTAYVACYKHNPGIVGKKTSLQHIEDAYYGDSTPQQ